MEREFEKTPWWLKVDKRFKKDPLANGRYGTVFYDGIERMTNKEVLDTLNNQDKKIKEQEEKIRRLTCFMDVVKGDEVFNVFDELDFIKKYLEFFIENNLEGECVECESESLLEIRKRLEIVIEPYVEAACMEELDDQGDD